MTRFSQQGNIAMEWVVAAPADLAAPTAAEITAATDILGVNGADGEGVVSMAGFKVSPGTIPTPDAAGFPVATIPGPTQLNDCSITYYMDDTTTTIQDLFTIGLKGHLILMPNGVGVGNPCTVLSVTVLDNSPDYDVSPTPSMFTVSFSKASQTEGAQAA